MFCNCFVYKMLKFNIVLLLFFLLKSVCGETIVSTPIGNVAGSTLISANGKEFFSFRGIPYAKPPIGDLRFEPPVMVEYSSETIDGTKEGPACPQHDTLDNMSEDCLTLNVYTGNITNAKLPVIVYIHPGGYYSTSSQSIFSGPEHLLNHDVVLVTINYRLGSLGFMSTGDRLAPGNNGLKDQVLAFKWVKQNIASFGGDADRVTIAGYSAGSMSITLHMLSPMSRGLFHRAISMSGAATANWEIPAHQFHLAKKQADLIGCPSDTSEQILNCLRTKNATTISDTYDDFFEFRYDPIMVWLPVVEPDFGQERFLTDDPINLIKSGNISSVPLIIGMTEYEFAAPAYAVIRNDTLRNKMNDDWNEIAPITFLYERGTDKSLEISAELKRYYLNSEPVGIDERSAKGLRELYADGVIGFGVHRFTNLMAKYNDMLVFYYKLTYKGRYSHFYLSEKNDPLGAVHHDDLIYLFNLEIFFPKIEISDPEYQTVLVLTKLWTDFAENGYPTSYVNNETIWPAFTNDLQQYLDIGSELIVKECMYCERFAIWESLFPLEI